MGEHRYNIHIYTYCSFFSTTVLRGGRTQNVSYILQGVFGGGLESVSLHFEGILKTLPTNFTFKGGSEKMYLTFWYGPP